MDEQGSTNDSQGAQPADDTQVKADLPSSSQPQGRELPIILLVEDDPVLCRMYKEKFKHEGFEVLTAYDGETGLKLALEKNIDMILLDIMLPKISGTDLLEKLRQSAKGKDILVVVLTNLAEQQEKEKALKYGAKEYLVKAMQTPEQVVEKVKQHLIEKKHLSS